MTNLFWPGDARAGRLMSEGALVAAMVRVEAAWLDAMVDIGVAPTSARADLSALVVDSDIEALDEGSEAGGNPVIPLVALLRERLAGRSPEAARWLHRGLTSQDVLDTALVLCARDCFEFVGRELAHQIDRLAVIADQHRATPMVGRTLTQHAVPITFGTKAAAWLGGLLDAAQAVATTSESLPAQFGGAAGTLSAATQLADAAGLDHPASRAVEVASGAASALRLAVRSPWHSARGPITAIGFALCAATSAWGRIANDVLTLSRPEIGELAEGIVPGRGGSSTMPQKVNPVLSVLIRRAALESPAHQLLLQSAAALAHDERPAGSWHVEWQALHLLGRHTAAAASQATELLDGLTVDAERMAGNLDRAGDGVHSERRAIRNDASEHDGHLDAADLIITSVIERAGHWKERDDG